MINTKSNVSVRIDSDVKEMASHLFALMGLDQTTAIDMFYRQVIAEKRLPFKPTAAPPLPPPLPPPRTPSLDEQIVAAALKRNPKRLSLPSDENGNVIIDKDKYPDIYDWAVNG